MKMWDEFKKFAFKGNVMDMAIGVVIGSAFSAIVTSLVNKIIMPLVGLLTGNINFSDLQIVLSTGVDEAGNTVVTNAIGYGDLIQTVLNFLIIAFSIFLFVKLMNTAKAKMEAHHKKEEEEAPAAPAGPTQEELLTEIRDLLKEQK